VAGSFIQQEIQMVDEAAYAREQQQAKEQQQAREKNAREEQKKGAEAKQKSVEAAYGNDVKPTPTQEENDLAALGVVVDPKEPDGSGEEPQYQGFVRPRQSDAKPSGAGYTTRGSTPAHEPTPAPTRPRTT
jgi:hypothetical protein